MGFTMALRAMLEWIAVVGGGRVVGGLDKLPRSRKCELRPTVISLQSHNFFRLKIC